jgi:hypothetical protein
MATAIEAMGLCLPVSPSNPAESLAKMRECLKAAGDSVNHSFRSLIYVNWHQTDYAASCSSARFMISSMVQTTELLHRHLVIKEEEMQIC